MPLLTLAGCIVLLYWSYLELPNTKNNQSKITSPSKKDGSYFEIQGGRFYSFRNDKKSFMLNAEKISIQKRSIGYFRFSLLNEVMIENAFIELYDSTKDIQRIIHYDSAIDAQRIVDSSDHERKNTVAKASSFNGILSKDFLGLFPIKKATSIRIEPVHIALYKNDSVVSRIAAATSVIRLQQRDIHFKENVRIDSKDKTLTTDSINFNPNKETFSTDQYFTLKTPHKRWEGKGLTTDIYLHNPIF